MATGDTVDSAQTHPTFTSSLGFTVCESEYLLVFLVISLLIEYYDYSSYSHNIIVSRYNSIIIFHEPPLLRHMAVWSRQMSKFKSNNLNISLLNLVVGAMQARRHWGQVGGSAPQ